MSRANSRYQICFDRVHWWGCGVATPQNPFLVRSLAGNPANDRTRTMHSIVQDLILLLEAMRFSVAVGGAWHVGMLGQRNDKLERRLVRLWQRYEVSQAIAERAAAFFK